MCLNQSVMFYDSFLQSPLEISPLLAFYSVLNLTKVHLLTKMNNAIKLKDVDSQLTAHGASKQTIEKVILRAKGTFRELAILHNFQYPTNTTYTLHELYRNIPDLKDVLCRVYGEKSNFAEVFITEDFSGVPYRFSLSITAIGFAVSDIDYEDVKNTIGGDWDIQGLQDGWYQCNKDIKSYLEQDKLREYIKVLDFSMDKYFYLNINPNNSIPEVCAIYLILLMYSSLVRYNPKSWKEKLDAKDRIVIDKFCNQCVLKFWSLICAKEGNEYQYLI